MKRDDNVIRVVRDLLAAQSLGVLATSLAGQPHPSLVAFVAGADLRQVWFATERATRKYHNLLAEARADEHGQAQAVYLAKHPALPSFVRAPTCALMCLAVQRCLLVRQFQHVQELVFDAAPHA